MSKKIIAFGGSTSSTSINKKLAIYAASLINDVEIIEIDFNDYSAPLYNTDIEKDGFPESIKKLNDLFISADGFVISLAEHNGSYAAAYKNTIDWLSRLNRELFGNKPMLLMASSPGGRGGATVLEAAKTFYPYMAANIISSFSFPSFYDNFKDGKITNQELDNQLREKAQLFEVAI